MKLLCFYLDSLDADNESDSNQPAKSPKKIPKILDGKYFEVNGSIDVKGNVQVKCLTCDDIKRGNVSSTGNFFKHYEKVHPLKFNEIRIYTKMKNDNTKQLQQPTLGQLMQPIQQDVCSKLITFVKF